MPRGGGQPLDARIGAGVRRLRDLVHKFQEVRQRHAGALGVDVDLVRIVDMPADVRQVVVIGNGVDAAVGEPARRLLHHVDRRRLEA